MDLKDETSYTVSFCVFRASKRSAKHAQTRIGLSWREKREKITHVLRATITLPVLTVFSVVSFP